MDNDVRGRRSAAGWSQSDLAQRVGVTRQTIISIEKGRFDPSIGLAFKLAEIFGCAIEDIFFPENLTGFRVDPEGSGQSSR